MSPVVKWAGAIAGIGVAVAVLVPAYVYLASEAVILRRYPLPAISEPPAPTPAVIARGAHLVAIAGCSDCHGADLEGRSVKSARDLPVHSANLRLAAKRLTDGEFERALRDGVAPGAESLWVMPSADFTYLSEQDAAAILAYLRSLPAAGRASPEPKFDLGARLAVLDGRLVPSVLAAAESPSSLDPGPRYDGARYLARISCGQCHGTDLGGSADAPDLAIVSHYSRVAFFDLLRRGKAPGGRAAPAMARAARLRFHALADYEIIALYDYLIARAQAPPALVARTKADAVRRRAAARKGFANNLE